MNDFSKEYFQKVWGPDGYYEVFSYGVGIHSVCDVAMNPFFSIDKCALEIGSGGGTFTQRMVGNFKHITAIDVIKKPSLFDDYENFTYIELPSKSYDCPIGNDSIDFAFCYNVFCHLSNDAITKYIKSVNRVLKKDGDFVFMLSDFEHTRKFTEHAERYSLGDLLPMGHFYQDIRTIDLIVDDSWYLINNNLIPDHRDIVVHLKKK